MNVKIVIKCLRGKWKRQVTFQGTETRKSSESWLRIREAVINIVTRQRSCLSLQGIGQTRLITDGNIWQAEETCTEANESHANARHYPSKYLDVICKCNAIISVILSDMYRKRNKINFHERVTTRNGFHRVNRNSIILSLEHCTADILRDITATEL